MPRSLRLISRTLSASLLFLPAVSYLDAQDVERPVRAQALLPDAPAAQLAAKAGESSSADQNRNIDHAATTVTNAGGSSAESDLNTAKIGGTVTDTSGEIVPEATVTLEGPTAADHRTVEADDNAGFEFANLKPDVPYRVAISAKGFADWRSEELRLHSGDFEFVTGIKLELLGVSTTITVSSSQEQIATQQVYIEEQQRVLGFIPNFYVVYDSKDAVPMTTKLKFKMALRVSIDPVSILGSAFLAGINQAADTPDYPLGAKGYGERFGAVYTDGLTDTMFGGAILPSLLHQDPRYFYQGTGTIKSRTLHALAAPFVCKGDNGKLQPNYSSVGGDLISASISNAYYPASSRGISTTFENLAIDTAEREASTVIQEFIVRKLTPSAKRQN